MAANVFGQCLHGDIHAVCKSVRSRLPQPTYCQARPSRSPHAPLLRSRVDPAPPCVIDPGLSHHTRRVFSEMRTDAGSNGWGIKTHLNSKTAKHFDSELAVGRVDAFWHQDVVPGFQEGEIDERDCTPFCPPGVMESAVATLQFADFGLLIPKWWACRKGHRSIRPHIGPMYPEPLPRWEKTVEPRSPEWKENGSLRESAQYRMDQLRLPVFAHAEECKRKQRTRRRDAFKRMRRGCQETVKLGYATRLF